MVASNCPPCSGKDTDTSHVALIETVHNTDVLLQVSKTVKHQKKRTQKALLQLQYARQSKLIPDLLVPKGWQPVMLDSTHLFYKVVAAVNGGLVSVYDGRTQYKLGQSLHARRGGAAWPPLDACYFAFPNMQQAASVKFPKDSCLSSAPQLLIQVSCHGRSYRHESGMWALSHVKPVDVISQVTGVPEVVIFPRHKGL